MKPHFLLPSLLAFLALATPGRAAAEDDAPDDVQVAVYYFPNWGPENASEWGPVKRAQPRFEGHAQPKVPAWGHQDETDPAVMAQKIDAAADHGVDAFIFCWYYYNQDESGLAGGAWDGSKYLYEAVRYTMTNRPFVILFLAYVTIIVALFSAQSIAPLLMQHYVFGGDAIRLGNFQGMLMTMGMGLSYLSIFLISWISMRSSKRTAMVSGLALAFVGTALTFIAIDPRWPWMLFVSTFIAYLGLQGCWLMVDSMTADVCDDDELRSGRRREGMFSAVKSFALKAAQGLTFGIGGYMATAAGYDPQIVDRTGLDEDTAWKMKAALVGFQCAGLLLAIAIMWLYPITRQRAEETQRKLREISH
jgi:Na+/melibiose symporter-like transporter